MPPMGRKHCCKHCKKSFPSGSSLGGHMALHRNRRKKQPSVGGETYGLRERCQKTGWLPDSTSSDDDRWALFPKTECQLCFKSFASPDALSMHIRVVHTRRRKMAMEHDVSIGDGDHNAFLSAAPVKKKRSKRMVLGTIPSPVMKAYGIEEVDAAWILVMLSGDHGMCSAFLDCGEGGEMDANVAFDTLMTEMELSSSDHHGPTEDNALMEPETSSSYEEVKFVSLSKVLKATASHECRLCGQVFASGNALGGHKKVHRFADRDRVPTIPKFAAAQPCEQLLPLDHQPPVLSLPSPNIWNYSSTRPMSEPNPLLVSSSLCGERMLGVI